jgi:hypothetical protein
VLAAPRVGSTFQEGVLVVQSELDVSSGGHPCAVCSLAKSLIETRSRTPKSGLLLCVRRCSHCALCIVHCALCIVHCALCIVHCALCIVHCALHPTQHVRLVMFSASRSYDDAVFLSIAAGTVGPSSLHRLLLLSSNPGDILMPHATYTVTTAFRIVQRIKLVHDLTGTEIDCACAVIARPSLSLRT